MFKIKFIQDDEINEQKVKSGEERQVSRSIRDAKIALKVAEDVKQKTVKKKK